MLADYKKPDVEQLTPREQDLERYRFLASFAGEEIASAFYSEGRVVLVFTSKVAVAISPSGWDLVEDWQKEVTEMKDELAHSVARLSAMTALLEP